MEPLKRLFNIKPKQTSTYKSRSFGQGRKVYKKKIVSSDFESKPTIPKPLPTARKISPTSTYSRVKQKQVLDLRTQGDKKSISKRKEGILVAFVGLIVKSSQFMIQILFAGAIIFWNGFIGLTEFILETVIDIFFFLRKALLLVLGSLAFISSFLFAGTKMPKLKLPKIALPEIRVPKIDANKEQRKEIPHIAAETLFQHQPEDIHNKRDKKNWLQKVWSFFTTEKQDPSVLGKHHSVNFLWRWIPLFVSTLAGALVWVFSKIRGFTFNIKAPTIGRNKDLPTVSTEFDGVIESSLKKGRWNKLMAQAKKHKRSRFGTFIWRLFILGCILGFIVLGIFFIWVSTLEIPELGNFADRQVRQSTKIYDKTGEILLYDVFKEERRTVVPLSKVSENMQKAILATEDDQFYSHHGVLPSALLRSVINKIKNPEKNLAGGSTITQQVIKNSILTDERRIERKVKEWVLAWRLENQLSKEEILEAYFNEIAFGGSVYGVEQAARSFFDKNASEVTLAESAYLAAVPKAPTFYSPYGSNFERLEGRKDYILGRMLSLGYISQRQYKEAVVEEVAFVVREDKGIKAPHFVFYVIEYLENQYGVEAVEREGLKVITTLDWELQKELELVTKEYAENLDQFNATNLATVAIESKTGKIISMVGSKDYFADDVDGKFNVATAFRQPGSTFKPFVYAQAFEIGYSPKTVLWDVKTEFSPSCFPDGTPLLPQYADRCYSPQNFGASIKGPISMESALAESLNIPAVKTLYLVGVGNAIQMAKKMGITGLNKSAGYYGLNLVLGGGEVRLLDMTSAYSVFGNDGKKNPPTAIMVVQAANGEILESYEKKETQVLSANVARMISGILSSEALKRPTFGNSPQLYHSDTQVAVKTGTTNSFKDTWTVGYTPEVSVGVWVGNNDNSPMAEIPSATVAAPYWRGAMDKARGHYKDIDFVDPVFQEPETLSPTLNGVWQGNEIFITDSRTGLPAGVTTPEEFREEQYLVNYHSLLHWVSKRDPLSAATSQGDALYDHWEYSIPLWAESAELLSAEDQLLLLTGSTSTDSEIIDVDTPEGDFVSRPTQAEVDFTFKTPEKFAVLEANKRHTIEIKVTGPRRDIDRIFYYVNNTYLGSGGSNEIKTSFTPNNIRTIQETNLIRVIIQTDDGGRIEHEQVFKIQQ